jgi:hypothetical protein
MAVRPHSLATPEDGLDLDTRQGGAPASATAATELEALRLRIDAAIALLPPSTCSCTNCWLDGCRAVIQAFVVGKPHDHPAAELCRLHEQLELARALDPPRGLHWRDRWLEGRDAAVAAIEGADT